MGFRVDQETAQHELDRMCQYYDIDFDILMCNDQADMGEEFRDEKADIVRQKLYLLKAIRSGDLTVDENGQATYIAKYTPPRRKGGEESPEEVLELKFKQWSGRALASTSSAKSDVGKLHLIAQHITGVAAPKIAGLEGKDYKIVGAMISFLAA